MNKFLVIVSFWSLSLSAMQFDLPSSARDLSDAERAFYSAFESKLINFFNTKLGIDFARPKKNDPMIERLIVTAINRAFVLQNPIVKKRFCKLFNNPKTRLNSSDLIDVDKTIANEAVRSILAERRLLTYIAKGTYAQPWLVRPEFDKQFKKRRVELGLHHTHKMQNPVVVEILEPARATWKALPQRAPVAPTSSIPVIDGSSRKPGKLPEEIRRTEPLFMPPPHLNSGLSDSSDSEDSDSDCVVS
jgi:hypothetical protein